MAEVAIGIHGDQCNVHFTWDKSNNCCSTGTGQDVVLDGDNSDAGSDFFFVYGTVNVSVQQKWLSPTEQHYHEFYIDKINPSDPHFRV